MKKWLILFFLLVSPLFAGSKVILKVFHAGSLSIPFREMKEEFEEKHPEVEVRLEPSGSVLAIRKITDLHKSADVVAVADYSLIEKMLFPTYADRVYIFGANEMVLAFSDHSKYHRLINERNWYEILSMPGVKWGFSNPLLDPCGYSTLVTIALAEEYYRKKIFSELVSPFLNVTFSGRKILLPSEIKLKGRKVYMRPKAVELLGLIESGFLDYIFEYRSVAMQHRLKFLKLPEEINLSSLKFRKYYSGVKILFPSGKIISGKPILYGISPLLNAPHPHWAREWVKFVTGKRGAEIMERNFQKSIYPPVVEKAR